MLVKDLMDARILMVREDTKLLEAIHLMRDSNLSMFAVVNDDTALRGVVYTEDLLRVMFLSQGERYGKSMREYELMESNADRYSEIPVKDVMRVRYISTNPYEPVLRASSVMTLHHLPCLPVIDMRGHALGVVSQAVILRELIRQQAVGSEMEMRTKFKEEPRSGAPRLKTMGLTEEKDRRKFVRVGCDLDVAFEYADPSNTPLGFEGKTPCRAVNVSAGGMAIAVTKFLENGTLVHLDFPLNKEKSSVRVLGRVVRWDRQKDSNLYMTGVQFLALTSDDRQEIERYVRTTRFQPEQKNWSSLN